MQQEINNNISFDFSVFTPKDQSQILIDNMILEQIK